MGDEMTERRLEIFVFVLICSLSILYFSIPAHVEMITRIPHEMKMVRVQTFEKTSGFFSDQWTQKEFSFFLNLKGKRLKIRALAGNPDIRERPLILFLWVDGKPLSSFQFTDAHSKTLSFEIPHEYEGKRKHFIARLSHTFVPKDYTINEDTRELGLLIRNIWTTNRSLGFLTYP